MGRDATEERERRPAGRGTRQPKHIANWMDASPGILQRAISAAASIGGALRFGYSRDGGAFAVGVYGDGDPYTDFIGGNEPIDEYLEDYVKLFDDLTDQRMAATRPKKPGQNGVNPASA